MNTFTATVELPKPTPEQLAEAFWQMDDTEQARFFGSLGACALAEKCAFTGKAGHYFPLSFQMYMASRQCTPNGLRVMQIIGEPVCEHLQPYLENFQIPEHTQKGKAQ
jgi:hypothetical protein